MTITTKKLIATATIITATMASKSESAEGDESVGRTELPAGSTYINSPTANRERIPTWTCEKVWVMKERIL